MNRCRLNPPRRRSVVGSIFVILMTAAPYVLAQQPAGSRPRPRPVRYRIAAGDFNGDGRSEAAVWDSRSRTLNILDFRSRDGTRVDGHALEHFPTAFAVADLDGDGRDELVVGEGLRGYNRKGAPPVDIRVRVYRPLRPDGWTPEEVFRKASERPTMTALEAVDLDGDRRPELLFSCFVSKYMSEVHTARFADGAWSAKRIARIRMGMHVTAARLPAWDGVTVLAGRPYGDTIGELGGVFALAGETRHALPAVRGVSSVAAGDVYGDGRAEILIGDGWHQNYGRIARARLSVIRREKGAWRNELIEDLPEHMRIVELVVRDLDGDGRKEVVARGERPRSLGGDVRLYRWTPFGWRGRTLAERVQGFAIGRFLEDGALQLVAAGPKPTPVRMPLSDDGWDEKLAEGVETRETKPDDLVGRPSPPLEVEAWIGKAAPDAKARRSKVVLLDFWATWCKPCIAAFPTLRRWQEEYAAKGLLIIGVTHHDGQTRERIERFVKERRLPWPVAVDPRKRPQVAYAVGAIPHLILIDRHGVVRLSHIGSGRLDEVERAIQRCLEETR